MEDKRFGFCFFNLVVGPNGAHKQRRIRIVIAIIAPGIFGTVDSKAVAASVRAGVVHADITIVVAAAFRLRSLMLEQSELTVIGLAKGGQHDASVLLDAERLIVAQFAACLQNNTLS